MRLAVSGSHGTGKSTLIASFLERRPGYRHEPEAYEVLADDIALEAGEGPTPEGLEALLQYTLAVIAGHGPGSDVVFERCAVDYLAYAAAGRRGWTARTRAEFRRRHTPAVRASLRRLDLIVLLPVCRGGRITARAGEGGRFRRRVDEELRRALLDDELELLGPGAPPVAALAPAPERWLADVLRLTAAAGPAR
jgi:hypothetical protein